MPTRPKRPGERRPRQRRLDAAAVAFVVVGSPALVVLAGWALNAPALVSSLPVPVRMKANTALALLILSACGLALTRPRLGRGLRWAAMAGALAAALLAAAILFEHATGADLGIDWLITEDDLGGPAGVTSGRVSVVTAACVVLLGLALLLLGAVPPDAEPRRWATRARWAASVAIPFLVGFAAIQALLGRGFAGAELPAPLAVSVPAAVSMVILSVGLFLSRPDAGALLASRTAPTTALLACLALTLFARAYASLAAERMDARRFEDAVLDARQLLVDRMEIHLGVLVATRGMVSGRRPLDREVLTTNVEALRALQGYSGFQGIGYAPVVPAGRLEAHEAQVRRDLPDYRVWPEGERPYHAPVLALEPQDARNRLAIGFDMASDPIRLAAMERARDTGRPAMSGEVTLVQEGGASSAGFLIYVPVYAEPAPASVEERRRSLIGFVYSPFNASKLFHDIFAGTSRQKVDFEIFDCEPISAGCLLHDDDGQLFALEPDRRRFGRRVRLEIAGRPWTIHFSPLPEFNDSSPGRLSTHVTVTGVVLSLLVFALLHAQVRARLAVEASVEARDAFLSIASHELKTPITPLLLQAQSIVALSRREGVPAALARKAEVVERSVMRLSRLIGELLDLSRLTMGRLDLSPEPMDLSALAAEIVERMREESAKAGSTLAVRIEPGVTGAWDRLRIDQAITNLLANAIKYGEGRPIELSVERRGAKAVVRVRDHGIGIAPEDQERIFQRFERAVSVRHFGGFGLGLWIVREIVEASGGSIEVESRAGEGSTFTVALPA